MRKIVSVFFVMLVLGFAAQGLANTVTINLDNVYSLGINVASMQMNFSSSGDFPFLSDDNDIFATADFSIQKDFGNQGAISWHGGSGDAVFDNWGAEALEDYDSNTLIAKARGLVVYSLSDNPQFALHDGIVVTLTSNQSDFSIDLGSLDLYNFVDTANPIVGLTFSDEILGGDQIVTISGAPVPIPGAIWLLGSGLLGLVTIRRRRG